ncbi:MAG TPA: CsgG/HfaB family protein [Burkholderiaceae bacterium]|nr:CsgG/HfaB family protein [Burkholderiaceae bacterium]
MRLNLIIAGVAMLGLAGCLETPMNVGSSSAKTVATGSAGGGNANNANAALERCDRPVGTAAFIEDTSAQWYSILTTQYRLPSTTMVLRMLAQQSNCFVVVERGRGMQAIQGERALAQSGELRQESNFGKGQLAAADYAITPSVTFSAGNTGGVRGGLAGFSSGLGVLSSIAGGVKNREASTMLALTDNRSGIQVAIAEGSASRMDFDVGTAVFGSRAGGSLGAYQNTPEGKILVAAFTDSFNQLVRAVKNYTPQQAPAGGKGLGTGGTLKTN